MDYERELKELALDTVALVFSTNPELAAHAARGSEIAKTVCPWATDSQLADVLHFTSMMLEAIKLDSAGDGIEATLNRASDSAVAAAAYAKAKAAGRI